jgi:hypothetical protein
MNVFLYYRTYWGKDSKTGWLGRNILAKSKLEMIQVCNKSFELKDKRLDFHIKTIACVDNSNDKYTAQLESLFDEVVEFSEGLDVTDSINGWIPIWGLKGGLIKVLNLIHSRKHLDDDIILILEDDYIFNKNGFNSWVMACNYFDGFVSPYDHPFNYFRNDMFRKIKSIEVYNNIYWRETTCNTSVVGGKYKYFRRSKTIRKIPRLAFGPFYLERFIGAELPSLDIIFYRRIKRYLGISTFSPMPGLAQHLSIWPSIPKKYMKANIPYPKTELSPYVNWVERYNSCRKELNL